MVIKAAKAFCLGFVLGSGFLVACSESLLASQDSLEELCSGTQANDNDLMGVKERNCLVEVSEAEIPFADDKNDLIKIGEKDYPKELKIFADKQYDLGDNVFVAEGNVLVTIGNGLLKAKRLELNRISRVLIASGDLIFKRNDIVFYADKLTFNLSENKGEISNIYGVIDMNIFEDQYDLLSAHQSLDGISDDDMNEIDISSKDEQIRIKDFLGPAQLSAGSKNKWRIEAPSIIILPNAWEAKEMSFTNDPFTPAQVKIIAFDVKSREDELNKLRLTIGRSKLVLEDTFEIPSGRKDIGADVSQPSKWIVGLDSKDRDGFFIAREGEDFKLGEKFSFSAQPQFLIQRAMIGKTDSYIESGKSITSDKVESDNTLLDLVGLKSIIEGQILDDWLLEFSADISTFNTDRFFDGSRFKAQVSNKFETSFIDDLSVTLFSTYRNKAWNGSLGETEIYRAYGGFLEKEGQWDSNEISYDYILRTGIANYQAEANENKDIKNLSRASLFSNIRSIYPIYSKDNSNLPIDSSIVYTPRIVYPELNFVTELEANYYSYGDGSNQALLTFSAGPEFTFGNFQDKFLDYTKLSIMPGITLKDGDSPFKFDNAVDLKTISVDLKQQIIGPLLLETSLKFNIDSASDNYGKFARSKISLLWERRSYNMGIYYDPRDISGGLYFNLNGFDFEGKGTRFSSPKGE